MTAPTRPGDGLEHGVDDGPGTPTPGGPGTPSAQDVTPDTPEGHTPETGRFTAGATPADVAIEDEPPVEDEVARIVAAWRRERPDLDVAPLEVLSRVSRLSRHLDRQRAAAFSGSGLEPWEFDVLAALRRSGPPYQLSPGTLIGETLVTSGTMTNRIDRLEARGLVQRGRDPDDGRGVLVRLTAPGRALVDTALAALLDRERTLLTGLSERDRTTLAVLLRRLVAPFDAP